MYGCLSIRVSALKNTIGSDGLNETTPPPQSEGLKLVFTKTKISITKITTAMSDAFMRAVSFAVIFSVKVQ